jgi:ankyrin repeat protein
MEPTQTLFQAIQTGDPAEVARALERHPEWKSKLNDPLPDGHFGGTAVLAAVGQRNREIVDVLLKAGADINARSKWWAGSFGVLDSPSGLEEFLIERGARVDAHAAARLGMLDRLKELVAADPAVVHARGGDGQTPLHFAATVEIAEFLADRGADINARDIDHESTPAQYAAKERPEVARFLVSRGCETDLLLAAALGDGDLVRRHLDANPEAIRMTVSREWFPMRNFHAGGSIYTWVLGQHLTAHQVARKFGHEEVFRILIERTPDDLKLALACELGDDALRPSGPVTLTDADRVRLIAAAQNNNADAVRRMLESGWSADIKGADGVTALHWAGFHGNAAMARAILPHHPPLEDKDVRYRSTPLGWAIHGSLHGWYCRTGDYAGVVTALLDAGAKAPEGPVEASEAVQAVLRGRTA